MGYGAPGHDAIHPLDAELCLPARLWSYEYQRRLVKAVVCGPFDEAIALIAEITGTTVPKRSAEQIVQEAAVDFESFYAARAADALGPAAGEILVGAIDCKGIPMVKRDGAQRVVRRSKGEKAKEDRDRRCRPQPAADRAHPGAGDRQPVRHRHGGRAAQAARAQPQARVGEPALRQGHLHQRRQGEMTRRDPEHERTWVIVTDGERALQRRVCQSFQNVTLVLDLLHVLEKLWKAAHALYREGSPEAELFVRHRAERILCGIVSQVVKGLRQTATKRRLTGAKAKAIHQVADYLYRNRERMRYDHHLANGWPIASGTVEGACKNLIRDRSERSGMRWTPETAEAVLQLRAAHLSHDFDDYWEHHVKQDQQRLYLKDSWQVVLN